jgi:NADH:ubiquinone oxidoreductase subunit 4 (subunit M)
MVFVPDTFMSLTTRDMPDLTRREVAVLTPLTVLAILLGIVPSVFVFALSNTTIAAMFRLF